MESNNFNSFAIFRYPFEKKIKIVKGFCQNNQLPIEGLSNNNFVVSPFNSEQNVFYIPFEKEQGWDEKEKLPFCFLNSTHSIEYSEKNYSHIVELAKKHINENYLQKVVLANRKEIKIQNFNPINFYKKIESEYKNAFVYLISTPQTGVWIGASPEPLLITSDLKKYKTIALAGTILKNNLKPFTEKESVEQKLVEYYIENKLNKLGIQYDKSQALPYESGNLIHLKTEFTFDYTVNNDKILRLLEELNPTPATAGIPKDYAIDFINNNEGFNRELYTGFLGLTHNKEMNLFVNLRCMKVTNNSVVLYAGAGITKDSNPNSEWIETQNKMKTLEKYL
jgi:isochorismate synthase